MTLTLCIFVKWRGGALETSMKEQKYHLCKCDNVVFGKFYSNHFHTTSTHISHYRTVLSNLHEQKSTYHKEEGGIASSSVSEEFRIGILKPGRSGFQE
jgi:hypothetical protein